jgi:hypothetical protein
MPFQTTEVLFVTAEELIRVLKLKPHPEGGFYRETYRSTLSIPGAALDLVAPRSAGTAIYYLLAPGTVSRFHRLRYDEIFHFYMGDPVRWVSLTSEGGFHVRELGFPNHAGWEPQWVVPAGTWFAGALAEGGSFALMGTTMAPGFEFSDFEIAKRDELLSRYPKAEAEILRFT